MRANTPALPVHELGACASKLSRPVHTNFERWRKPASAAALGVLVAAIVAVPPSAARGWRLTETVIGFALVVAAVLGRIWCAIYIAGRKNAELCVAGPYSLCRHPLYFFSSLGVLGVVLATHRPVVAALAFGGFWLYHTAVIRGEERRLQQLFGQRFRDYRALVPCVRPRLAGPRNLETLNVDVRPFGRALTEVGWFFAAWLAAHLICAAH